MRNKGEEGIEIEEGLSAFLSFLSAFAWDLPFCFFHGSTPGTKFVVERKGARRMGKAPRLQLL